MNTEDSYQDITETFASLSKLEPQEAFIRRINATIHALPLPSGRAYASPRFALRFLQAVIALSLFIMVSSVGVAVAATRSNPGDALYGVKRAMESVELAVASSTPARAVLRARIAGNRVEELHDVVSDHTDEGAIESLVTQYQEEVEESLEELDRATPSSTTVAGNVADELEKHTEVLEEVREKAPAEHQQGIEWALEVSQRGQEEAHAKGNSEEQEHSESQDHGQSEERSGKSQKARGGD